MPAAHLPADETKRLAALEKLNILHTAPSADFDIFPLLASDLLNTPIAAVSLVGRDKQWFKARIGLDAEETPRDVSFCAHALLRPDEVLCVPDATKDPRFSDNELVTGPFGLRFYAGAPIRGPGGEVLGALCVIDRTPREMTDASMLQLRRLAAGVGGALRLHASTQELQRLSLTDELTGLTNRMGFEAHVESILARTPVDAGSRIGLVLVDLDHTKFINELFGYAGGDAAICEAARRLAEVAGPQRRACRFGGDQFGIVVETVARASDLLTLAGRLHAAIDRPFLLDGQLVPLRCSIGVVSSGERADTPAALLRLADKAVSAAKRAGRGTTRIAADRDALHAGRRELRNKLRAALVPPGHEPFQIALQPIGRLADGALLGFEALVRWPDLDGRAIPPDEFIPIAEDTGLVTRVDRFVLDRACAAAVQWPPHLTLSSNFSAANFLGGDLVSDIRAALSLHRLDPHRLKLEITERVLLQDPERVQAILSELKKIGIRVELDDFGSGHSSLAYLRDYTLSGLKIDRSFIAALDTDRRSQALVSAIADMARALGIEVVAEGVERPSQLDPLRDRAVGAVQGYLLGRPMSAEQACEFARTHATCPNLLPRRAALLAH